MIKYCSVFIALVFIIFSSAVDVSADVVDLDNGDRLSGTIIRIAAGEVVLQTEYAGELRIDFAKVTNITTEQPGRITLKNGNIITGQIQSMSQEQVVVNSEILQAVEFPRALFAGLNEPAAEAEPEELIETRERLEETEASLQEAQKTIEEKEAKIQHLTSGSELWKGRFSLGIDLERGNTTETDIVTSLEATRSVPREELKLKFLSNYGETDREADTNEVYGLVKLKVFQSDRRYIFGFVDGEYDEFENLNYRGQVFGGPGYIFIKNERTKLAGEIGPGVVGEFTDTEDGTDSSVEFALGLHSEWNQKLFNNVEYIQGLSLFPSVSDFGEYRIRLESTLRTPLRERWLMKLTLRDDYDSDPEEDTEHNDLQFITALEYEF
jgi:putative salt-induced outer membrane protein YdiY